MGKTLDIARDRAFDQTATVLPAEVARGVYMRNAPSLRALKLMHLMIATAGGRMADEVRHDMRLSDIRKIDGMAHHDRASLTPLFVELAAAVIEYDDPEKRVVTIGGLMDVARIDYRHEVSGDLLVSWWFGRLFREMAAASNHWAIIDRQTVFHLGSKYSVLLFQYISSLLNLDRITAKTFTMQELRSVLGISEGKLERFSNLKQIALAPAIAEINQLSRLSLTVTPNKIGRTVGSVTIGWEVKADPAEVKRQWGKEPEEPTKSELKTAKIAKKLPTMEFPSSGSVSFGIWGKLVRDHAPRPTPDPDVVAADFRTFCSKKSIALNSKNIEATFVGFCKNFKI